MRNCEECGAELSDEVMKCTECGSGNLSIINENENENENENQKAKGKKFYLTFFAIIAVLLILVVLGVQSYFYLSKSIIIKPVEKGIYTRESGDLHGFLDSLPEAFRDTYEDEYLKSFKSIEGYNSMQKSQLEEMFGADYSVEVKVVDLQKVSDVMIGALNLNYQNYSVIFEKAYYVTLKILIANEEGIEFVVPKTVYSVKVDNNWYLFEDFDIID